VTGLGALPIGNNVQELERSYGVSGAAPSPILTLQNLKLNCMRVKKL
jgi:hypothetical protein